MANSLVEQYRTLKPDDQRTGGESAGVIISIAVRDYMLEGMSRFGNDEAKWRFKCPACGAIQSPESLMALSKLSTVEIFPLTANTNCSTCGADVKNCSPTSLYFVKNHNGEELRSFCFDDETLEHKNKRLEFLDYELKRLRQLDELPELIIDHDFEYGSIGGFKD